MLGKVTKFLVENFSTSEVISQKPHGGWKTPLPRSAFRVKRFFGYGVCMPIITLYLRNYQYTL